MYHEGLGIGTFANDEFHGVFRISISISGRSERERDVHYEKSGFLLFSCFLLVDVSESSKSLFLLDVASVAILDTIEDAVTWNKRYKILAAVLLVACEVTQPSLYSTDERVWKTRLECQGTVAHRPFEDDSGQPHVQLDARNHDR